MRRNFSVQLALPLLAFALILAAPSAAAQTGPMEPVDGVVAEVQYTLNNTLNPPPGNGTNPPGNGTNPPGNGTTPPGNVTTPPTPPGNGTTPPGDGDQTTIPGDNETTTPPADDNGTAVPDDNATADPAGNETADPAGNHTAEKDGNETAAPPGNATGGSETSGSSAGGSDGNATVQGNGSGGDGGGAGLGGDDQDAGSKSRMPCVDLECQRGRTIAAPIKNGFPWLPILLTLTLAPLVGLVIARYAIKRWQVGKPVKHVHVEHGPKGPADAHDPMRKFLMDVKEWRSMPMPGSAEGVPVE